MQSLYQEGVKNEMLAHPGSIVNVNTPYRTEDVELALSIAHFPDKPVPEKLGSLTYYNLLKFTGELGIMHILRPSTNKWLAQIDISKVPEGKSMGKRLFMAWELGDRHSFESLVTQAALNAEDPQDGKFVNNLAQSDWFKDLPEAFGTRAPRIFDGIFDAVRTIRLQAIKDIYAMINDDMTSVATGKVVGDANRRVCRANNRQDRCELLMAGYIHQKIHKHNLSPMEYGRLPAEIQTRSVNQIIESIEEMRKELEKPPSWSLGATHRRCHLSLTIFTELDAMQQELSVTLNENFNEHFSRQGQLMGLEVAEDE
ncbi:hypothetical protein PG991_013216 [Apiospora marii]|uniref:Uncharacterized protein n=2 Tax=Apiospora marii TaxID=335849 RepID=A0ABR1R5J1_9PEZI